MKRLSLILAGIFWVMSVMAQDMKSVFISMPDSVAPLLTKVNKEDCVDFLASNMKAEVKNRFGNVTELKELTDDYMLMQTTASSSMEMKLLPLNDSVKVICMVKTVCASACDSEIHFFDTSWQELPASDFLQMPSKEMFYVQGDSISEDDERIRMKADMDLVKGMLSKDSDSLTFVYTTPDYLNKEDREKLVPYLRKDPVVLLWKDGRFSW